MAALQEFRFYFDPEEALCVKGVLEANGLSPMILFNQHLSTQPHLRLILGGFVIVLPISQLEDAEAVINYALGVGRANDTAVPEKVPFRRRPNWSWLITIPFFTTPYIPRNGPPLVFLFQLSVITAFLIFYFL